MLKTHDDEYAYRRTWDREPLGRCRVRILEADGQVPVLVVTICYKPFSEHSDND